MFRTYAQQSVLKLIDDISDNKDVRALTEGQKKLIFNNTFNR